MAALTDAKIRELIDIRVEEPERIAAAYSARRRRARLTGDGSLFIVAADHPARGAVGVGADASAMTDRRSLLERLLTALEHPRVDGVLASADIMDDLAVLGALEGKLAVGTMNRGGLAGAVWELDDRFTAYDTAHLLDRGLDAGKMLLRIDDDDHGTNPTLHACAQAVQALNDASLMAMVEPIPYTRDASGARRWDDRPGRLVRAVGISAALGGSSARTWLKIQSTADVGAVARMTTQPLLILGGNPSSNPEDDYAAWARALAHHQVRGLVVGRALLYPSDGDVVGAVARAANLVTDAAEARRD